MACTVPGSGTPNAVSRNEIVIDAPPEDVYATLLDPSTYPKWVVGAKDVRAVDRRWPRRGARFYHKVGAGPAEIKDNTKLIDKEPNKRVVLEVRFRPVGVGTVAIDLKPKHRGRKTKVVMREQMTRGPVAWIRNPMVTIGLKARNAVSLRRLRRLVASSRG
jgi:uncharacterized protein YndB with AHSA1/START domain